MLSLFQRKIDSNSPRTEISDVVERIEVTAFPGLNSQFVVDDPELEKIDAAVRPVAIYDFSKALEYPVSEEKLFTPNNARQEFQLAVGCSAFYIAEGTLALPELSGEKYALKFGLPTEHLGKHWWFLRLKDGEASYHGYSGEKVVEELLTASGSLPKKEILQIAKLVAENILLNFLGPRKNDIFDGGESKSRRRVNGLIGEGYALARASYSNKLAEILKAGIHETINPVIYKYKVSGDYLVSF